MATYTSHYNLKKPALSDKIRIADFNGNADIIDEAMNDNATMIASLKSDIGIVENTNTATHNISAGQYVIWKGSLYTASSAISSGATLSDANLTAVSGGGLNALNSKVTTQYASNKIIAIRRAGIVTLIINGISGNGSSVVFDTLASDYRPTNGINAVVLAGNTPSLLGIGTDGKMTMYSISTSQTWYGCVSYAAAN